MNYRTVKLRILRMAPKTGKTEVTRRSGSNLYGGEVRAATLHARVTTATGSGTVIPDPRNRVACSGSRGFRTLS